MKSSSRYKLEVPIDGRFVIDIARFDNLTFIDARLARIPSSRRGVVRSALRYLYETTGPTNLPKERLVLAIDFLELPERIVARWLYTRTNGSLRKTYGKQALAIARQHRYRCQHCGYPDVRALELDHIGGRVIGTAFACLCANCHRIKSREHDWTGKKRL